MHEAKCGRTYKTKAAQQAHDNIYHKHETAEQAKARSAPPTTDSREG